MDSKKAKPAKFKALGIVIGMVVLLLTLTVFMFTRTPEMYAPSQPSDNKVSPYITHHLGPELYNNVQLDAPFNLLISEEGINDIIARNIWPQRFGSVSIDRPAVVFQPGMIHLMGTVDYSRLPFVATITAYPRLNSDGKLQLNIATIKAGSVDITVLAKTITGKILADQTKAMPEDNWMQSLSDALIKNSAVEPVFEFPGKNRDLRITAIDIKENELMVTLKPL